MAVSSQSHTSMRIRTRAHARTYLFDDAAILEHRQFLLVGNEGRVVQLLQLCSRTHHRTAHNTDQHKRVETRMAPVLHAAIAVEFSRAVRREVDSLTLSDAGAARLRCAALVLRQRVQQLGLHCEHKRTRAEECRYVSEREFGRVRTQARMAAGALSSFVCTLASRCSPSRMHR